MDERMFPVLPGWSREERGIRDRRPCQVPWRLLAPHEHQARRNHDQTLERLAERGGLSIESLVRIAHALDVTTDYLLGLSRDALPISDGSKP